MDRLYIKINLNEYDFLIKLTKAEAKYIPDGCELEMEHINGDWFVYMYCEKFGSATATDLKEPFITDKQAKMMDIDVLKCLDIYGCYVASTDIMAEEKKEEAWEDAYRIGDLVSLTFADGQKKIGLYNGSFKDRIYITEYITNVGKKINGYDVPRGTAYQTDKVTVEDLRNNFRT